MNHKQRGTFLLSLLNFSQRKKGKGMTKENIKNRMEKEKGERGEGSEKKK